MTRTNAYLAVLYRSPYLLVAIAKRGRLLELRRHRVAPMTRAKKRLASCLRHHAARYRAAHAVLEPGKGPGHRSLVERAVRDLELPCCAIALPDAMRRATGDAPHPRTFYDRLVAIRPELRRFVRILPGTGRVARSDRWRLGMLQVAALALAGEPAPGDATPSPPPELA